MRTALHHLITDAAARTPDRPALTHGEVTLTYAELLRATNRAAWGLTALGLDRGDRVGIVLDKRIETITGMLGCSAAGGVFVPVNPALRAPQVRHVLGDCDVRVVVTTTARWAQLAPLADQLPALEHVVLVDVDADPGPDPRPDPGPDAGTDLHPPVGEPGGPRLHPAAALSGEEVHPLAVAPTDLDMAAILYTSGSTGSPKGVVLSHRNLLVGAESVSSYLANTADDVILSALPLSFDAGLSQVTTALAVGAHVVLLNYLLPGDVPTLCARHGVTGITAVPPLWIQLAALEWPEGATSTVRYIANTGGRMPRATLDRLREVFPKATPFLMYGLTEAFRSTYLDPAEVDRRPDSIGKAIPDAEILVLRPDGTPCSPGEEGELVHRGPLVAMGYWNDPDRTAERFRPLPGVPAWRAPELAVFSGDTVRADDEGFLYFVGRTDDMIKTSGYRVSPTEVEEVAYATGLVRDAVALGLPDERVGHRVVLVASPAGPDPLDTRALVAAMRRELPLFMVPAEVVVREAVPRSPNGKFDRQLLKQELGHE